MAFTQHIGIYKTIEEFQAGVSLLETPWVAYVGTPETDDYRVIYPNDLVLKDSDGVNIGEDILKLEPICCTEDEYEILVKEGAGNVTDVSGNTFYTTYDPDRFYYTYDADSLNEDSETTTEE